MKKVACIVLLAGAMLTNPALADIDVYLAPPGQDVLLSAGTATVEILADIPEAEEIASWGLDLDRLGTSIGNPAVQINLALFDPAAAAGGDDLSAFILLDNPVWGNGVLLATVTYDLLGLGQTDLTLKDDNAYNGLGPDLTEGFGLNPPPSGEFGLMNYTGGYINVIPEPTTLSLLVLGGLALLRRR